jgi:Tfp pilus assembly protein PilZ
MASTLDPSPVAERRRLRVAFSDADSFRREFEQNLSKGGIFVPTELAFELRELVHAEIALDFCDQIVRLPAEIVASRPADLAAGAAAGVALQILEPASELRERFRRFLPAVDATPPAPAIPTPPGVERRKNRRDHAEVGALLELDDERASARTRDLSATGALMDVHGAAPEVGDEIRVTLVHPTRGEAQEVAGRVVRREVASESRTVVAVQFEPEAGKTSQVRRFVEDAAAADHARRLGAIAGPIADLGVASLLQMFAMSAPRGTLLLTREGEAGSVAFEGGMMRAARAGAASGLKALARLLAWRDGTFEFRAGFDASEPDEAPTPLDATLLEAMRQCDELARCASVALPPHTRFKLVRKRLDAQSGELGKTEQAVADLVAAGFSLARLVDVIPVPDAEIHGAVSSLLERGVLVPR